MVCGSRINNYPYSLFIAFSELDTIAISMIVSLDKLTTILRVAASPLVVILNDWEVTLCILLAGYVSIILIILLLLRLLFSSAKIW